MNKNRHIFYYLTILISIIFSIIIFKMLKLGSLLSVLWSIIIPFLGGYIFAWLLTPLNKRLKTRLSDKISITLITSGLVLIYASIILVIVPIFINESTHFFSIIKSYLPKLQKIPLIKMEDNMLNIKLEDILTSCGGIINVLVNIGLIHLFGIYILFHYTEINTQIKKFLPSRYKNKILMYFHILNKNMYEYIRGTLIDMGFLFGIALILLIIFKMKYAIFLAFIMAITNVIPFIGPYIGGIPVALVGFSNGTKAGIISIVIIVTSQMIESNVINPLIMSKCVKINPLFIIITITLMGKYVGIWGMALAVPLLIVIKTSFEFYLQNRKVKLISPVKRAKVG